MRGAATSNALHLAAGLRCEVRFDPDFVNDSVIVTLRNVDRFEPVILDSGGQLSVGRNLAAFLQASRPFPKRRPGPRLLPKRRRSMHLRAALHWPA